MSSEYSISREIKRLRSVRGYGTELISIYVPAGFQLSEEIGKLKEEYSQSSNIKSKSTRGNVQSAIDKIIQYLRLYRETPKNGLVVFCGNLSDNQSKADIELFSIEPPLPLKVNIYRCDSTFMLDPLELLVDNKDTYALLVMDGREATVATLKGAHIQVFKKMNSTAHAKVRKGGQSAARYERVIEEQIGEYYTRIGEAINMMCQQLQFKVKGLIVGGPGPAKEGFAKADKLNYQIKILGVYDTGYTDEYGLQELLEKAQDLLREEAAAKERKVLERFMQERVRNGLATYGYENTKEALESGKAGTLILSEDADLFLVKYECSSCKEVVERIEEGQHREAKHSCGGTLQAVEVKDIIEELLDMAEKAGTEIVFVSSESSYGKEFLMGFKGIGALLRYR